MHEPGTSSAAAVSPEKDKCSGGIACDEQPRTFSKELLHILQHSLGLDSYGRGRVYRNHFVTGPDSSDFALCLQLCDLGCMEDRGSRTLYAGGHVFVVTGAGLEIVLEQSPPPPKVLPSKRRYQEFLDADSGLSFGEWIKMKGKSR
jgi:hypothetical protein